VTMTAFKRCGDPPNPITCYEERTFTMNRNGEGAVWTNPSLADGVVKPISFQVTLLDGETKIFQEEDWVEQQGFDPMSAVWAPQDVSTTTVPIASTATTTWAGEATTTTDQATSCNACGSCVSVPGNPHAATDEHCSPCAMGGQSWWPCDVNGLCQCSEEPGPVTTTMTTTIITTVQTTAAPASDCKTCSTCVSVPGNPHAATDVHCSPCAMDGQAWWPCDVDGLCQCA